MNFSSPVVIRRKNVHIEDRKTLCINVYQLFSLFIAQLMGNSTSVFVLKVEHIEKSINGALKGIKSCWQFSSDYVWLLLNNSTASPEHLLHLRLFSRLPSPSLKHLNQTYTAFSFTVPSISLISFDPALALSLFFHK